MLKPRLAALSGLVFCAAAARLIPHPPNFSPIAAMALFGGAYFSDKRLAFGVPLAALFLSDLVLGFYPGSVFVYGSFALIVCIGLWLRSRKKAVPIAIGALVSSLLFFVITNFGHWAATGMYPMTRGGLVLCYAAAIPFLQNTVAGDLFFSALLFGGFALAEKKFGALRETAPAAGA